MLEAESLGGSAAGAKRSAHGAVHKAVNEGYIDEVLRHPDLFQVQDEAAKTNKIGSGNIILAG